MSQTKPVEIRSLAFEDLTALLGYMSTYLPYISESGDTQVSKPFVCIDWRAG